MFYSFRAEELTLEILIEHARLDQPNFGIVYSFLDEDFQLIIPITKEKFLSVVKIYFHSSVNSVKDCLTSRDSVSLAIHNLLQNIRACDTIPNALYNDEEDVLNEIAIRLTAMLKNLISLRHRSSRVFSP